jgi:hypothetical protein
MSVTTSLIRKLEELDPKTREAFLCFMDEIEEKTNIIAVGRGEFNELKEVVRDIGEAQKRTDLHVEELAEAQKRTALRVEELAEAQKRTELRVEELAEAQKRTELRVEELAEVQKRTALRVEELAEAQKRTELRVEELAEAQKRTELRVEELAEAQKRTELRVEELAEAQKRTELRVEELAEAQKKTEAVVRTLALDQKDIRKQLGGLAMAVGYGLEDRLMPYLPAFLARELGLEVTVIDRRNVIYPDGRYDEVNLYGEATKDEHPLFVIGECKAQPGKKDFVRFQKKVERLQQHLHGEVLPLFIGYHFTPEVEAYVALSFPTIRLFKTFRISA